MHVFLQHRECELSRLSTSVRPQQPGLRDSEQPLALLDAPTTRRLHRQPSQGSTAVRSQCTTNAGQWKLSVVTG